MNIAIVVPICSGFGKKGFYNSQEIGLGKELVFRGHTVDIYKCVAGSGDAVIDEIQKNLTIHYQPVKHIGVHSIFDPKCMKGNEQGVLVFSDTQIFLKVLWKYCTKKKIAMIPYVGIAHSYKAGLKSRILERLFKFWTLPIYKKVTVLVKSNAAQNELCDMGVHNCIVTPVGLDFEVMQQDYRSYDRKQLRQNWNIEDDEMLILYVARLTSEKRPLDMVKMFLEVKKERKAKLMIIGYGPMKDEIDEFISKNDLLSDIIIIDKLPYNEMWKAHYAADCFVSLRLDEIFGMAVMESAYYGSQVISVHAPGPDMILKDLKWSYLCDNDKEIIKKLKAVKLDRLPEEDIACIKKKFTWKSCADAFCDLIK